MYALMEPNPANPDQVLVEVYSEYRNEYVQVCWGGYDTSVMLPFIVYTVPYSNGKDFSEKQKQFFQVFLLAAYLHFVYTGEMEYRPAKPFDAYTIVFPEDFYPFGEKQEVPEFFVG